LRGLFENRGQARRDQVDGIINLVKEARKFRFQVNLGKAQHAGLKISSRLLKLMIIVN
jgi:hypothetical protein